MMLSCLTGNSDGDNSVLYVDIVIIYVTAYLFALEM